MPTPEEPKYHVQRPYHERMGVNPNALPVVIDLHDALPDVPEKYWQPSDSVMGPDDIHRMNVRADNSGDQVPLYSDEATKIGFLTAEHAALRIQKSDPPLWDTLVAAQDIRDLNRKRPFLGIEK